MSKYIIDPITGEVVPSYEDLSLGGCVLSSDSLTDADLARDFDKMVTAKVDGKYVGWSGVASFVRFKAARDYAQKIEDISYWGYEHQEFCRMHLILMRGCGHDITQFYRSDYSIEEEERYFSGMYGIKVPTTSYADVAFKRL